MAQNLIVRQSDIGNSSSLGALVKFLLGSFVGSSGLIHLSRSKFHFGITIGHLGLVNGALVGLLSDEVSFHIVDKGINIRVRSLSGEHGLNLGKNSWSWHFVEFLCGNNVAPSVSCDGVHVS